MKSSKSFPPRASKLDATNLQNKEFFTTKETWSQQKSVLSIKEDNTRQSRKWILWGCHQKLKVMNCQNREEAKTSRVIQNWVASIKRVTNILHSTKYVTKCHKNGGKSRTGRLLSVPQVVADWARAGGGGAAIVVLEVSSRSTRRPTIQTWALDLEN